MNVRIEPTHGCNLALVGTPKEMAALHEALVRSVGCEFGRIHEAARQLHKALSDPRVVSHLEEEPDG